MEVKLIAHTKITDVIKNEFGVTDGQIVALTAIRTCYSHMKPTEIVKNEGEKYFKRKATDGKEGSDAERLFRYIIRSGHTSTMEHLNFTFSIEGVTRSLLAQLTRHRHFSYSVQSQRYNKLETDSKSGGFGYIVPEKIKNNEYLNQQYEIAMRFIQRMYDDLREKKVPAEDARMILPNAATCNLVLTGNLRAILEFYEKRSDKRAQWEIRELAERIKAEIVKVEPWLEQFFQ